MRVLVIGPEWVAGTTGSVARAFTVGGCRTTAYACSPWFAVAGVRRLGTWWRRLHPVSADRHADASANAAILAMAERDGCELAVIVLGGAVTGETVRQLRRRCRAQVVLWLADDPFIAWQNPPQFRTALYDLMRACDRLYVFDEYYCAAVAAHTGVSCHYLPLAYDDAVFAPATEQAAKQYQVVMVGERFPLRAACLAALDGVVADVWGGDFRDVPNCRCHPPVPPAAANRIYQQAVLCFNAHHPQSVWDSNARVFEVAGAGGCLLTDAKQALTGQFRIGEEVLTYSSPAEFADKARFLLAHPEVAAAIGARAAQRARREHTYAARIRRLLADCG